ncbi:hypothetical protein M501DRAFT_1014859 [Patellaria atrata CBS 101060]|uniref:Uncharacterized protein n=1 Tax=Patellaria atrata CBS 101060 TaxID=1346257 RepID=A0A9P4SDV3_9PEZI|nr:hypothetical protein M501DRAFT_1014859 [Patellaria atrata CBS 101060]
MYKNLFYLSLFASATTVSGFDFFIKHALQTIATGSPTGPTYIDFAMVQEESDCGPTPTCDAGLKAWNNGDLCDGTQEYTYNVCDRSFSLRPDGDACAKFSAFDDSNDADIPPGATYAQLWEGESRVGTCYVDYGGDDDEVNTCGTSTVSKSSKTRCWVE